MTLSPATLAAIATLCEIPPADRLRVLGTIVRATVVETLATDTARAMAAAPHLAAVSIALAHLTTMLDTAPESATEEER